MRAALNTTLVAAILTAASLCGAARAAGAPDLAGHWEGMAVSPLGAQNLGFDFGRLPDRSLKGAMSSDQVNGLPLTAVRQEGDVVRFAIGSNSFEGRLDTEGKTLSGLFSTPQGEASVTLTRDGEAKFEPTPVSARVDPRMEGVWEGVLEAEGRSLRIRLTLANRADGHAEALLASLDEGFELPALVATDGAGLKLSVPTVGAAWAGTVSPTGDSLVGDFSQRGLSFPLSLRRAKN